MEIKPLIEALLFVTEEPLPPAKIAEILAAELQDVRKAIKELQLEYATADHGLQIMEIAKV